MRHLNDAIDANFQGSNAGKIITRALSIGEKNKNAFKTIIYDDGELTEDKIYLTTADKNFRVMPAKLGNVLLVEFNKKEKSISLHLEKLNIN